MNVCAVLLADFEVVKSMSNRFHGKQAHLHANDYLTGLGLLAIVVLVAWGLSRLTRRSDDRPSYNNPRSLFRELCQAHGIDRSGRSLMQKMARSQDLPPAQLFLEPERWQAEALGPQFDAYQEQCLALYERLFVEPKAPAPVEPEQAETVPADEAVTAAS